MRCQSAKKEEAAEEGEEQEEKPQPKRLAVDVETSMRYMESKGKLIFRFKKTRSLDILRKSCARSGGVVIVVWWFLCA
jgi:hypothetical protein